MSTQDLVCQVLRVLSSQYYSFLWQPDIKALIWKVGIPRFLASSVSWTSDPDPMSPDKWFSLCSEAEDSTVYHCKATENTKKWGLQGLHQLFSQWFLVLSHIQKATWTMSLLVLMTKIRMYLKPNQTKLLYSHHLAPREIHSVFCVPFSGCEFSEACTQWKF